MQGFLRILTEGNASILNGIPGITEEIKDSDLEQDQETYPSIGVQSISEDPVLCDRRDNTSRYKFLKSKSKLPKN